MKAALLVLILNFSFLMAQNSDYMIHKIELGEDTIKIVERNRSLPNNVVYINVHEDEETSITAVEQFMETKPLHFIFLKHHKTRRIDFSIKQTLYSIDPNRIYTNKGRKETLRLGGTYSIKAKRAAKRLAKEILAKLPKGKIVVSVHNNSDLNYTIKSYLPGGDEAANTAEVYISDKMDADDFIYTTEKKYFDYLKAKEINVILQDNENCTNDGSLSVYCGKNGIPYLNIEAEIGKLEVQLELIRVINEMLTGE
jgi:hypothetical protein